VKAGARALGIDDAPFERGKSPHTKIVGVLMRGVILEGVEVERIEIDGLDATDAVLRLHDRLGSQARVIFTHGTVVAGFNPLDLNRICSETGVPVIAILDRMPSWPEVRKAMLSHGLERNLAVLERNPPYEPLNTEPGSIVYARSGISRQDSVKVLTRWQIESKYPEPLRVAHLISKVLAAD